MSFPLIFVPGRRVQVQEIKVSLLLLVSSSAPGYRSSCNYVLCCASEVEEDPRQERTAGQADQGSGRWEGGQLLGHWIHLKVAPVTHGSHPRGIPEGLREITLFFRLKTLCKRLGKGH